jgi:hypothetical protein
MRKKTKVWVIESKVDRSKYPDLSEENYVWGPYNELFFTRADARDRANDRKKVWPSDLFRVCSYIREHE